MLCKQTIVTIQAITRTVTTNDVQTLAIAIFALSLICVFIIILLIIVVYFYYKDGIRREAKRETQVFRPRSLFEALHTV